ncbi:MAG: hypothetical protein WBO55_17920 [Rhizobiaceae bacterium]
MEGTDGMIKTRISIAALVIALPLSAFAQSSTRSTARAPVVLAGASDGNSQSARYELRDEKDGFVRLDTRTGELSFCQVENARLVCRVSSDEREAYESELARLEDRLDELSARLEAMEQRTGGQDVPKAGDRLQPLLPENRLEKDSQPQSGVPEEDAVPETVKPDVGKTREEREFDSAMDFAERAMRRFFEAVKDLRKDLEKEKTY